MESPLSLKPNWNNRRIAAVALIPLSVCLWQILSSPTPDADVNTAPVSVAPAMLKHISTPGPAPQQVAPVPSKFVVKTAEINQSQTFDESLASLGVSPSVGAELVTAFAGTLDFQRDVRAGDQVTLVFRNPLANALTTAQKPIAVQLSSATDSHRIVLYKNLNGQVLYYRGNGESTRPAFSRYPIAYKRISSPFSRRRLDPVTHRWQAHDGVDLAAPIGTPVHATSTGTIKFIGRETGYGRLIIIKNQPPYTTRFAHLSRFAKGLKRGDHVRRGQVIAYVGESGWATGPHLHYEVREDHIAMNPLTVDLPHEHDLQGKDKERFAREENALNAVL